MPANKSLERALAKNGWRRSAQDVRRTAKRPAARGLRPPVGPQKLRQCSKRGQRLAHARLARSERHASLREPCHGCAAPRRVCDGWPIVTSCRAIGRRTVVAGSHPLLGRGSRPLGVVLRDRPDSLWYRCESAAGHGTPLQVAPRHGHCPVPPSSSVSDGHLVRARVRASNLAVEQALARIRSPRLVTEGVRRHQDGRGLNAMSKTLGLRQAR